MNRALMRNLIPSSSQLFTSQIKLSPITSIKPSSIFNSLHRHYTSPPESSLDTERLIAEKLKTNLSPTHLSIEDTSGGCGSFFRINIVSEKFTGLSLMKQHRLVKDAISDEIAIVHGVTINTLTPQQFNKD